MALTKADMVESLFNELGLNKREAGELVIHTFRKCEHHSQSVNRSNFPDSEIAIFGIKTNAQVETLVRVKKLQLRLDGS